MENTEKQPTYNRKEVENTPFSIYTEMNEDNKPVKSIICVGRDRVSPIDFINEKEAEEYINKKEWDLICNTAFVCAIQAQKYVENMNKQNR